MSEWTTLCFFKDCCSANFYYKLICYVKYKYELFGIFVIMFYTNYTFKQILHSKGFSPVWRISCSLKPSALENVIKKYCKRIEYFFLKVECYSPFHKYHIWKGVYWSEFPLCVSLDSSYLKVSNIYMAKLFVS